MGLLITLAVLILIGFIRIGVLFRYNDQGALLRLILGPVKLTLVPAKKKEKKPKKETEKKVPQKEMKEEKLPTEPPPAPKEKKKEESGGSLTDFLPLVKVALDFVGEFFTRLQFNHLEIKLIMAGDDPCDLAANYGKAWAALGNLMPLLDNVLVIKKRDIEIECDFTAEETRVIAGGDITISIGRIFALLGRYGYRAVKEFITMKNKRKGGAAQ